MVNSMEKTHYLYITGLIIISIISAYVLIVLPHGIAIPVLESTFFLFGLALNSIILLWTIAGYLLLRWIRTKRKNLHYLFGAFLSLYLA